jgi:hypothetical protein
MLACHVSLQANIGMPTLYIAWICEPDPAKAVAMNDEALRLARLVGDHWNASGADLPGVSFPHSRPTCSRILPNEGGI